MGLDNGIIFRTKHSIAFPPELGEVDVFDDTDDDTFEYSLCYWRKCYSLRLSVISALDMDFTSYEKTLNLDDVKAIWGVVKHYENKKNWKSCDSIWEWRDIKWVLREQLLRLEWLIEYMKLHKGDDYSVYFYDSY